MEGWYGVVPRPKAAPLQTPVTPENVSCIRLLDGGRQLRHLEVVRNELKVVTRAAEVLLVIGPELVGAQVRLAAPEPLGYRVPATQLHGNYPDRSPPLQLAVVHIVVPPDHKRIVVFIFRDIDLAEFSHTGSLPPLDDLVNERVGYELNSQVLCSHISSPPSNSLILPKISLFPGYHSHNVTHSMTPSLYCQEET